MAKKKDCGCSKASLNKKLSFKQTVKNCLTKDQIEWFNDYKERRTLLVKQEDVKQLEDIYNHLFGLKYKLGTNSSNFGRELLKMIDMIEKVHELSTK